MSNHAPRPIDLALQGGGSHGAFTWGVLDRLLEDASLEFSAISGTSAGALNAAVLATGHGKGGREGARAALRAFWTDVSRAGAVFAPFTRVRQDLAAPPFGLGDWPGVQWMNSFLHSLSPYEFNPLNLDPLRDVVQRHVDGAALQRCGIKIFVTATQVHTGQGRVFSGAELSVDALLASACLPFLFQAVVIDGEPYWDGGYTGNPALYPLIYDSSSLDLLLVRINPLVRDETPRRSMDILDRLSEITFNTSLIAEMRAIDFVSRLLRERKLDPGRYKDLRMHMVADDAHLAPLGAHSKFDTDAAFLESLCTIGRNAAASWLKRHGQDVGVRSTLDIGASFLGRRGRSA
ncbi:MAG TPA: patatin-like phospholipase family protein [Albitalea sp.]|nr:patatin-like phospholipase family protein [Albitalea sp.]